MQANQPIIASTPSHYQKLYFIWYFDDEEGYGIEVLGERQKSTEQLSVKNPSLFCTVVNWTFGQGTWARDFRRNWGDFAANAVAENQGKLPIEISELVLRFNVKEQVLQGDLEKMTQLLRHDILEPEERDPNRP